jgi:hypothetical protein
MGRFPYENYCLTTSFLAYAPSNIGLSFLL